MIGIEQFRKIKECKDLGLSRLGTAKRLGLNEKTVYRW